MTIQINGANGLTFPDTSSQAVAGYTPVRPQSGGVIQTVQATASTQTVTNSGSMVNTALTASITPKFSTSKILISVCTNLYGGTGGQLAALGLNRNSTLVWYPNVDSGGKYYMNSTGAWTPASFVYLDSPATTSSTTYTVQVAAYTAGGSAVNQGGNGISVIILQEIAA
jgi:hypothetical protein